MENFKSQNDSVTFEGSNFFVENSQPDASLTTNNCYTLWFDNYYYPHYHHQPLPVDKGSQALKILSYLVEEKHVKVDKVKDFIKLMNGLVEIL